MPGHLSECKEGTKEGRTILVHGMGGTLLALASLVPDTDG